MDRPIDMLTGLLSGAEFYPEMENLIALGEDFALIVLDIDELFVLNRDFGHEAGDAVFRLIAKHINAVFPAPCLAFRGSRDEFEILMPKGSKEKAFLLAENLRTLINGEKLNYVSADGRALTQSVSAGISSYPDDGNRPADIFRRADSAMARAKKSGRNLVCLSREEKLLPKTSHYTQAQLEKLSVISEKINVGEASLLREALDDLLKKYDADDVR
ncbi:MAG: diguanylate cyclase [Clostridiales bacterium]|jgi:diguanylate cyclase (GGDEF)-like protein|nr:diguanylate cyclase [Clostridiales bacterium]